MHKYTRTLANARWLIDSCNAQPHTHTQIHTEFTNHTFIYKHEHKHQHTHTMPRRNVRKFQCKDRKDVT